MSIEKDFKMLKKIKKNVPLMNVDQVDVIWLVAALQYYLLKCKELERIVEFDRGE